MKSRKRKPSSLALSITASKVGRVEHFTASLSKPPQPARKGLRVIEASRINNK